jgi:hypothetical protein
VRVYGPNGEAVTDYDYGHDLYHHGLQDRKLTASDPMRAITMAGRTSHENESQWVKTVPLGAIEPNMETLVEEIAGELFMLFEFWNPGPDLWNGVLQAFLSSKL